jgi:hypothetical protein
LLGVITLSLSFVAIAISLFAYFGQRKQNKFVTLVEVFKLLNSHDERKARKLIYSAYRQKSRNDGIIEASDLPENDLRESIERIRADFDQIGSLNENKLIPEKAFLDSCWDPTIRCWKCLEDDIKNERKERNNNNYMKYFESLYNKAEKYRIDNNYPEIKFY